MSQRFAFALIALLLVSSACSFLTGITPASAPTPTPAPNNSTSPTSQRSTVQSAPPFSNNITSHTSRIDKDISYCVVDEVALKLDLYFPKSLNHSAPIVVYIHGGGWHDGDKQGGTGMSDIPALLDAGFIVGSVNYRLAPPYKFPAMIEDVKCAIRFLRAQAETYNIDSNKIGVWGGSAGGHLASLLGVTDPDVGFDVGEYLDQSSRVQAVVDMFGPADLTTGFSNGYEQVARVVFGTTDSNDPIFKTASPVTYISSDDPPFLILQGDHDQTVPLAQSQEFYDKLIAAGVTAKLVIVKDGNHGLNDPYEFPSRDDLTSLIVQFFKENLK